MSKQAIVLISVSAIFLVLAFLLNPSPEQHRATIKEVIAERSPVAGALGMGSMAAFVSTYHSYGIASYTTAGDQRLSFGLLGMVFVSQQ